MNDKINNNIKSNFKKLNENTLDLLIGIVTFEEVSHIL
jgi:hypothetical protein